jgi:hypothetical protein
MLGGLPLALVMTGRLLARRKQLELAALRRQGAVSVLSEHGDIPPDYQEKVEQSFAALLAEAWEALPVDRPLLGDILRALGCLIANAFVEAVPPLMVETPSADPLDVAEDPLDAALQWLDRAQLLERNQAHEVQMHPLIHQFAQGQADAAFRSAMGRRIVNTLMDPNQYTRATLPALLRLALDLEAADGIAGCESMVAAELSSLTRMLSAEAHDLRLATTDDQGLSLIAQIAYATSSHGIPTLHSAAEANMRANGEMHLAVRWSTAGGTTGVRQRLLRHDGWIFSCALSGNGKIALSASQDHK